MSYQVEQVARYPGLKYYKVSYKGLNAYCVESGLPYGSGDKRTFLYMICKCGILSCKGFSNDLFDALGYPHAVFSASTITDLMENRPLSVNQRAMELGVTEELMGKDIFERFCGIINPGEGSETSFP